MREQKHKKIINNIENRIHICELDRNHICITKMVGYNTIPIHANIKISEDVRFPTVL